MQFEGLKSAVGDEEREGGKSNGPYEEPLLVASDEILSEEAVILRNCKALVVRLQVGSGNILGMK